MWNSFLGKRIKGFKYAFKGAYLLLKNEASIQVQTVIAVIVTIAGFYFDISTTEWMFQFIAIGLVMSIEGLNTAAEEIANFVHPDYHSKIGYIKDVAAGAVFIAALTAVIIACIIYIPKF
ncbi:diacylglycerol kinase family protein [Cochleicola gelatinilyticus]|uniref:Diacylglycerol kinase n=1 Tax=Cochleicola gelatinilyticus TaxID=1763537 RepID=A0A167HJP7_9FLAO|nr:diacylglycerol kinase family protein [Cochleicola gelatinilyticus]OAB78681.1 diacylglycerol kinase [Cochleicola gelatinilyticus]